MPTQWFNRTLRHAALALAGASAAAGSAHASITVLTTQAAFSAATTAPGSDGFADLSITDLTAGPLVRAAGGYGYTASVDSGWFLAGGSAANPFLAPNTATDSVRIASFSGAVRAAGALLFGSDINGQYAPGDVVVTATDADGSVTRTLRAATPDSFLGFVSSGALLSLSVAAVQPVADFLWPSLDTLVLAGAAPVPEPAGAALWLAGLSGLAAFSAANRRRA